MVTAWLLLVAAVGQAAETPTLPVLRVEVQPETVIVGEAAELRVTLLGPTWFPKPPVFPTFELPNAVVRLPPDRSGPTSARVHGERWSGVTRSYDVFPLISASYRLGGGTMQVTVADPGADPRVFEVEVPEVLLQATVPEGARDLDPYIAGVNFRIWREMEGDHEDLQPGDGLVVRYFAELEGMPAIFLPPLTPRIDSEIVAVYADEPVLSEAGVSRRSERSTLVMKYGGEFTLPALRLKWWNRSTNRAEVVSVGALVIPVSGPPRPAVGAEAGRYADWRIYTPALMLLAAAVYLSIRFQGFLRRRLTERRARRLDSELTAFRQFEKACRQGDGGAIYSALLSWQKKLCPGLGLDQFAESYGDRTLKLSVAALSASLYADDRTDFDAVDLRRAAGGARVRFLKDVMRASVQLIPELNPR